MSEKKSRPKVLVPSIRNLSILPPVINFINCSDSKYANITVLSYHLNKSSYVDTVKTIAISNEEYPTIIYKRIFAKLYAYIFTYLFLYKNIKEFDFIWIGVWDYPFIDVISRLAGFKGKIVYQFHELELEKLKYCKKADYCVVPEENRLWITKFLGDLKNVPLLLPNIPFLAFDLPSYIPIEIEDIKRSGKKILLYQGLIDFKKRCLNELLEALTLLPDSIMLVIMPMPSTSKAKLAELKGKIDELKVFDKVKVLEPVLPPCHLIYIKYADIGIGLYRPTTLNQIYAAPNRLYEFTCFSIPVILPYFPAFKSLSSSYRYGIIAVDPESPTAIAQTIAEVIEGNNLSRGKLEAKRFFSENGNYQGKVNDLWKSIL